MNINIITDKIISDANETASLILREADAKALGISESYKEKADEIISTQRAASEKEATDLIDRTRSSAKTKERTAVLCAKNKMLDEAFENACKALVSLPEKEYFDFMSSMLKAVLCEQTSAEARSLSQDTEGDITECFEYFLVLGESDKKLYGEKLIKKGLETLAPLSKTITMSERTLREKGGFVLICGDIEIDSSVTAIVSAQRSKLEAQVLSLLFAN